MLLAASLTSNVLGRSVAAHVIEGADQSTGTRDFAGADPQRSEHSIMPDRAAEVVPASLALTRLSGPIEGAEPW
jgi:hypothetical protein